MKRFLSIWLPRWPVDRLKRRNAGTAVGPFALIQTSANTSRVFATNVVAARIGLSPGMPLADAMALVPALATAQADPKGDQAALERLADWCIRWSPTVATDGADGIIMDTTGVDHLYGGEEALLSRMLGAFRRMQVAARLAIADSPASAWAWARFGGGGVLPGRPASIEPLSALPVPALRIAPQTVEALNGLGLKTVGLVANLPRAPLRKRMGQELLDRLDKLFARELEPISPRQPQAEWRSRLNLLEPIGTREDIDLVVEKLLEGLCGLLEKEHLGARQLALYAYRVDGDIQEIRIGTSHPSRSIKHLMRLFRDPLDGIMPGLGLESFTLEALSADIFTAEQENLEATHQSGSDFSQLIDRLQGRLGTRAVYRYEPVSKHTPEAAAVRVSPLARSNNEMPDTDPRPHRLFAPEPIEVESTWDAFTWRRLRRRIATIVGHERLHGEWRGGGMDISTRDYIQVEDEVGRRYWLFRDKNGWFIHGVFA